MSRAHPGESKAYKLKQQKREERNNDRSVLRKAQKLYRESYGYHIRNIDMRRDTIESLKRKIRGNPHQ